MAAGGGVADTYPHTFRIVFESVQPTEHRLPILLPLPLAKDYFQEVPGPANQGHLEKLVLGEHFGTLQEEHLVLKTQPRTKGGKKAQLEETTDP